MSNDEGTGNQNTGANDEGAEGQKQGTPNVDPEILNKLVADKVSEELKEIKENLNKAYNLRDELAKKVKTFEEKERLEEIERLKKEGKQQEAYDKQLAEERSKREALEKRNVELTRDIELKGVLATLPFRNDKAMSNAFRDISGDLVQNEQGVWVHKSGVSIVDFVKAFSQDDENSFLFKQAVSSGTGSSGTGKSTTVSGEPKSVFALPQAELLKQIEEGKFVVPR